MWTRRETFPRHERLYTISDTEDDRPLRTVRPSVTSVTLPSGREVVGGG